MVAGGASSHTPHTNCSTRAPSAHTSAQNLEGPMARAHKRPMRVSGDGKGVLARSTNVCVADLTGSQPWRGQRRS